VDLGLLTERDSWDCFQMVPEKNAAAVALGRLGGLKGGRARARKLTAEQRAQSARKAAVARWSKKSGKA